MTPTEKKLREEIMTKNNQNIFDNITPKSALVSECLNEGIHKGYLLGLKEGKQEAIKWIKKQNCYTMGHILDEELKELLSEGK